MEIPLLGARIVLRLWWPVFRLRKDERMEEYPEIMLILVQTTGNDSRMALARGSSVLDKARSRC